LSFLCSGVLHFAEIPLPTSGSWSFPPSQSSIRATGAYPAGSGLSPSRC
jgi:hypothetical protein